MSNYYEAFYGYTGLFPILDDTEDQAHKVALRKQLADLGFGPGSLFSRAGLVHGARLFIIDDVVYNGHPTPEEHLQYSYLLLSMTFDGELAPLAERIAAAGSSEWQDVFSHCHGFNRNAAHTGLSVLEYLKKGQITTSFLYVDAKGSLDSTLRALVLQREVGLMLEKAQTLDIAARKQLVLELAAKMNALPAPQPGGFFGKTELN
jgi:hypothetical protein